MAERRLCKAEVRGSIPLGSTPFRGPHRLYCSAFSAHMLTGGRKPLRPSRTDVLRSIRPLNRLEDQSIRQTDASQIPLESQPQGGRPPRPVDSPAVRLARRAGGGPKPTDWIEETLAAAKAVATGCAVLRLAMQSHENSEQYVHRVVNARFALKDVRVEPADAEQYRWDKRLWSAGVQFSKFINGYVSAPFPGPTRVPRSAD